MRLEGLVWLAVGTGIGLTLAMFILAALLLADGRRLRRRLRAAAALAPTEPAPVRRTIAPLRAAQRPSPRPVRAPEPPPFADLPPVKPVETPRPIAVEPVIDPDELVAELERVQAPALAPEALNVAATLPPEPAAVEEVAVAPVPERKLRPIAPPKLKITPYKVQPALTRAPIPEEPKA